MSGWQVIAVQTSQMQPYRSARRMAPACWAGRSKRRASSPLAESDTYELQCPPVSVLLANRVNTRLTAGVGIPDEAAGKAVLDRPVLIALS